MSSVTKPRAKPATSRKTKKPRKAAAAKKGVSFKSRGLHRCVQVDGKNKTGLHSSLHRAYGKVDVAEAMAAGRTLPLPKPLVHLVSASTKKPSKYWAGNAVKAGAKLDSELTSTIKLYRQHKLDARFFHCAEHRKRVMLLRFGALRPPKGHATNWTNGKRTPAPFQARMQSTYDHCLLQATASSAMYAHTNPRAGALGPPMLVVCDGADLRAYAPPAWMQTRAVLRAIE